MSRGCRFACFLCGVLLLGMVGPFPFNIASSQQSDETTIDVTGLEPLVRRAITGGLRRIEKNPQSHQRHYELAAILDAHEIQELAIAYYQKALTLKPDHLPSLYNCGLNYEFLGRNEDARNAWDRILGDQPDHPTTNFRLGEYYLRTGQFEEALTCFKRFGSSRPGSAMAHSRIGRALLQLNRVTESLVELQKVMEIAPRDRPTLITISQVYLRTGNREKAQEIQQRLEEDDSLHDSLVLLDPLRAEVLGRAINSNSCIARAENYDRQGLYACALTEYLLAARGRPDHARLAQRIGVTLVKLTEYARAIEHLDRAIVLDASSADSHHYRGLARLQMGARESAIADFRKSLQLQPGHPLSTEQLEKLGEL